MSLRKNARPLSLAAVGRATGAATVVTGRHQNYSTVVANPVKCSRQRDGRAIGRTTTQRSCNPKQERAARRRSNGEGSMSWRNDGRWIVRLQSGGVRKWTYAYSKPEARKKLVELQRLVGTKAFLPARNWTVGDMLDLLHQTAKDSLKPTTVQWYRAICAKHIVPALGDVKLTELEPVHLQHLYLQKHGRIAQAAHRILHRALRLATMWGWIDSNPAGRVLAPAYSAPRKELWTHAELRQFLGGTANHWLAPLWTILILSGCRVGELQALKWTDVNLNEGSMHIRANLQRIKGKWSESSPKTASGLRTIYLSNEGVVALNRQRCLQSTNRLKSGGDWEGNDLVFTGKKGSPLNRASIAHAIARECKRVGVRMMTPHALRHLNASLLLKEGHPVPAVAARLGHSRPSITMAVYAHEIAGSDREAAKAIERALGRVSLSTEAENDYEGCVVSDPRPTQRNHLHGKPQ